MEKYWFVDYKFGVFSINHAWKEDVARLCVLFYIISSKIRGLKSLQHALEATVLFKTEF